MKLILSVLAIFFTIIKLNAQSDSVYLKNLFERAYKFEQTNADSALILYDKIIKISKKEKYQLFIAKANNYKGIVFSDKGKYDSAVIYYKKSIHGFTKINNQKGIAANIINIGNTFQLKGDFSNAISYYLKGISIYEKIKDYNKLSISYGNLATIFEDIGQRDDAIKNYNKSIKFAKQKEDSIQLAYSYYNISQLYISENKNDSAYINLKKAKSYLNTSSENNLKYLTSYGEAIYFLNTNDTSKALEKAFKAFNYINKTNDPYYMAKIESLLGRIYLKQNKKGLAIQHTLNAAKIAKKHKNKSTLIKVYAQLSDIYRNQGNIKKTLLYKDLEYENRDLVLNEKQTNNINALNIKYETEKKDKEIVQNQLDLEKSKIELQKKKSQTNYLLGTFIFFLVSSLLAWFLFLQRNKRKDQEIVTLKREHQIKTLESLIEGEEKERFRIAKELHDGVNGDLSAIKYKLSTLLEMDNPVIKEAITMIDNSCHQVRAVSHNLVPPSLDNFNLVEAVEEYCEKSDASHVQKITFQHLGDSLKMSKKEEINIFRIIQELVTNSIKHGQATEINVQISCRNKIMQITVEDNGVGFNIHDIESKGIGLKNIQSRVDYLHANLDVLSNKNGTSTTVEIDKGNNDKN